MSLNQLQDFYKKTITVACGAGAGNIYVATKPTVSNGYCVISPSSSTLREIVRYTGTGTDGTGDYITIAVVGDRGLGGTTAQSHIVGESIRMNVTSLHWADMITEMALKYGAGSIVPNPTLSSDVANKAYVDLASFLGGSPADTLTLGLMRLSYVADTTIGVATMTIASPAVVTYTAHGLTANDFIKFSTTGALPTGVTAGNTYFVISTGLTANTFQFSATLGGTAVNTTGSQSGVHTLVKITPVGVSVTDPRLLTQNENDSVIGKSGAGVSSTNLLVDDANTTNGTITDQSQTTQNGTVSVGEADATSKYNKMAQSFIAGKSPIVLAQLHKLADTGTFTGTVTVSIQADSSGSPSGSALATVTLSNGAWLALSTGLFTATFGTPYVPTLGTTYWLVIETSTSDNSNKINLGTNTAGGYASGSVKFKNTTDNWVAISTIDLTFYIKTTIADKVVRFDSSSKYPAGDGSQITGIGNSASVVFGESIPAGVPVFLGDGTTINRVIASNFSYVIQSDTMPTSSTNRIGQTFVARVPRMTGFSIPLYYFTGGSYTYTYHIYATSGGLPTGAALATGTTSSQDNASGVFWLDITLASALTLTQDATYAITLYGSSSNARYYRYNTNNTMFEDGNYITESASVWSSGTGDICFQVLNSTATTLGSAYILSSVDKVRTSSTQELGMQSFSSGVINSGSSKQINPPTASTTFFGMTKEAGVAGETKGVALAGNIVTSASIPTIQTTVSSVIDQQQTNTTNVHTFDSSKKYAWTTFVTGDIDVLEKIELYLDKTGTPGDVLTVSIVEFDNTTGRPVTRIDNSTSQATPDPANTLGSVTYSNADIPSANWYSKTFSTPITVRPRTKYAIFAQYGTYVATNYFRWHYGNTYGQYYQGENALNTLTVTGNGYGFAFKLYTTSYRYGYVGSNIYLSKTAGKLSFFPNYENRTIKIGKLASATQIALDNKSTETLVMATTYTGVSLSYFTVPLHTNTKRVDIKFSATGDRMYSFTIDEFLTNVSSLNGAGAGTQIYMFYDTGKSQGRQLHFVSGTNYALTSITVSVYQYE